MKVTKKHIREVVKSGNWMLRRSNAGKSYGGFQWAPVGEWTETPDWNPNPICGGGLHGNGPNSKGYWTDGSDIDFCEIDPKDMVDIDGEKIKVKRARVLLRNELPDGLTLEGDLDFSDCTGLKKLPENLKVGKYLNLLGCIGLTKIPDDLVVGRSLYLTKCTGLNHLPENLTIEGDLNLSRCTGLTEIPNNLKVEGWLDLRGCTGLTKLSDDLKIGLDLDLSKCAGLTKLPDNLTIGRDLYLGDLNLEIPETIQIKGRIIR